MPGSKIGPIVGVILAGGRAERMGGGDKGLREVGGKPILARVIERVRPQADALVLNANGDPARFAGFDLPVAPDSIPGFAGPLAGLHCGMTAATTELVATVPCDSPFLPADLISRLLQALQENDADLAVAKTGNQPHPVFCLCRKTVLPGLTDFLAGGGRKIDAWYAKLKIVEVLFDDQPQAFSNINKEEELRAFETGSPG